MITLNVMIERSRIASFPSASASSPPTSSAADRPGRLKLTSDSSQQSTSSAVRYDEMPSLAFAVLIIHAGAAVELDDIRSMTGNKSRPDFSPSLPKRIFPERACGRLAIIVHATRCRKQVSPAHRPDPESPGPV